MIRVYHLAVLTAALSLGTTGCTRRPDATPPTVPPRMVNGVPVGWKTYTPPEGDFSVAAPGEATVVGPKREGEQTVRTYVFRKGDSSLNVLLFDRTGKAAERDKLDDVRKDPRVLGRTLRDVDADGMPGLEFLYDDPQDGGCLMRVYRSADGRRAVTLRVVKPELLPGDESNAFLNTFKLIKK